MWFEPSLLKTEALRKVVEYSKPTIEKELRIFIRDIFFDFNIPEFLMSRKVINKECFNNKRDANYLERVLKDNLKVELYHELDCSEIDSDGNPKKRFKTKRYTYPKSIVVMKDTAKEEIIRVDVPDRGRPYVFKRCDFLTSEEI